MLLDLNPRKLHKILDFNLYYSIVTIITFILQFGGM